MSTLQAQVLKHASSAASNIALDSTGKSTFGGLIDTGSVGQIKFPATQNSSSDANTLDDYEEGSFTPVLSDGTNTVNCTGYYVKVGALVWVTISAYNKNISGFAAGTSLRFTGLPFATSAESENVFVGSLTSNLPILANPSASQTTVNMYAGSIAGNGDLGSLTKANFQSTTAASLWGQLCYRAT